MWLKTIARLVAASSIFLAMSGCGLFAGGASDEPTPIVGNPKELEITDIKIGALPTLDCAPLYLAIQEGLFADEGLHVTPVRLDSGGKAVEQPLAENIAIAFGSYTPPILAERQGVGVRQGGFRLVADATSLAKRNSEIVVQQNSSIEEVTDLRGRRIAVVNRSTMTYALTAMALLDHGIAPDDVKWVEFPFPATEAALANRQVDAAFLTEPFLSKAKQDGARTLYDTNAGRTESMPLTGYMSTQNWVDAHPKTLAAFSRAIQRATQLAANDTGKVVELLPSYIPGMTPEAAHLIGLTRYEASLDRKRIQRVPDLMTEVGMLERDRNGRVWDVGAMIVPPAPLTEAPTN